MPRCRQTSATSGNLTTYGGEALASRRANRLSSPVVDWLADDVVVHRQLGASGTTAQVHPAQFTVAMMRAAQARGAELHTRRVTGIVREDTKARGVETDAGIIEGDAVVIAMGPWSILASAWCPLPPVFGLKGHSLVFETGARVPASALFLDYQEENGEALAPEIFPRPDGTTYVCAISSDSPLPINPVEVGPDDGAMERLHALCCKISPVLASAKVRAWQACFRPITQDGLPLIGALPGLKGAYVATGHSVWGILNAPATGEAMAELIIEGAGHTVDMAPFRPERLPRLDPRRIGTGRIKQ
jgi:glycine/D-amino acid oxidase-like deaminating enzyme